MNFRLLFDPFVSWPLLWLCCAIAVALAAYLVYLRRRGWPYRVLSLALVIAALEEQPANADSRQGRRHGVLANPRHQPIPLRPRCGTSIVRHVFYSPYGC